MPPFQGMVPLFRSPVPSCRRDCGAVVLSDEATEARDVNRLEPRIQGHNQVSTETAEEFAGKG